MKWRRFFSFRNDHTVMIIIFGALAGAGLTQIYFPGYQIYAVGSAMAAIVLLMIYMELNAYIEGRGHNHIDLTLWEPGKPPRDEHFDVYLKGLGHDEGAAKRVADVFALIESDPRKLRFLRLMGGRFWYPYLRESVYPIEVPGYGSITKFCLLLPHPFTKFMEFTEREYGAYLTGTQYTHSASVHLEAVIAPFHVDFLGEQIPILIGISSSYTIEKVTQTWAASEDELARHFLHMSKIIEENHIKIFPEEEIDEMGLAVLSESQRQTARKLLAEAAE